MTCGHGILTGVILWRILPNLTSRILLMQLIQLSGKWDLKQNPSVTAFSLLKLLAAGKKWDLVFNIAEGLYGDGRESVVPAILDQYRIPYVFSGPVILGISLNKYLTRLIVSAAGVPVSPGMLISTPDRYKKVQP